MKKITAIFFALLVFATSLNIGVAHHYCGGQLVQSGLFLGHSTTGCGMEDNSGCTEHSPLSIGKNSCCNDKIQKISTDNFPSSNISFQSEFFFELPLCWLTALLPTDTLIGQFSFYRPPPGFSSVYLPFIQSFLI